MSKTTLEKFAAEIFPYSFFESSDLQRLSQTRKDVVCIERYSSFDQALSFKVWRYPVLEYIRYRSPSIPMWSPKSATTVGRSDFFNSSVSLQSSRSAL